jgi:bifunctional DNA-binding transcriptional regulator/antitoxin component of YhaV-PrlF toxin-antitoxin module
MLRRPYNANAFIALYHWIMSVTGDLRVSSRGQMSLPATTRHRWGLEDGGDVGYLDLGDAIVIVPGGTDEVRRKLLEAITTDDWQFARSGFGDDEMNSQ